MPPNPTSDRQFGPPAARSVAAGREKGPRVTAELGVRSISADAQPLLDRALDGLRRAADEGTIEAYDLFVTGEAFVPGGPAAGTAVGRELSGLVAGVQDWASRAGATVAPYFQHESVDCRLTDERYTVVRFPTLCLTEYHDGELAFVAPARVDGELVDVMDRIETLARPETGRIALSAPE